MCSCLRLFNAKLKLLVPFPENRHGHGLLVEVEDFRPLGESRSLLHFRSLRYKFQEFPAFVGSKGIIVFLQCFTQFYIPVHSVFRVFHSILCLSHGGRYIEVGHTTQGSLPVPAVLASRCCATLSRLISKGKRNCSRG